MCARRSTSIPARSMPRCGSTRCSASPCRSLNALMVTSTGGARAGAVDARAGRGRHGRDGAAAGLADHQHLRLGGLAGDLHLRECRRGAGRHDDHRAADHADRPAAGGGARGIARRDRVRGCALPLRPRSIGARRRRPASFRRAGRIHPDGRAGREDRPGRALRRRQVDGGQSAAALLRPRERPHPDRRPGHRRR